MLLEIIASVVVVALGVGGIGAFGSLAIGEIRNRSSRKHA